MKKFFNLKKISIFIETGLIFLGFWFLLSNLKTDGVWETVFLNVLFFLVIPVFIFKRKFNLEKKDKNWKIFFQIIGFWLMFGLMFFSLREISFLKLNYLTRMDWFLGDWWIILFLNLFLIPVILFCQEFFFREFLLNKLVENFSVKVALIFQAGVFTLFEMFFFEMFAWNFIVFNFILAFILGVFYLQTKTIWYSFFMRWGLILILDGIILYKIQ